MNLIILDRDGTINEDSDDYIKSPDEWIPLPGSIEAIGRLTRAGYRVVVATNQSGVSRGLYDMDMLNHINTRMINAVRDHGGEIDGIFFCPHGPDDHCDCRKPKPGLFNEIATRLKTNLSGIYSVGDSERDIVAARQGGAVPVLVRTGKGEGTLANADKENLEGVPVFDDLAAFTDSLLNGKLKSIKCD
ncbi:MAG: D-glycero-beta-D-manno-heptose 1,7-bisphosphate 7-phosphatase [Acidiferrobacterales bacterium]